jgi:histidinol-phosphate aminotransferase
MSLSRRTFVRTLGFGTAALSGLVAARGAEALAWGGAFSLQAYSAGNAIRLNSNENPAGPSPAALDAIRASFDEACRYPVNPSELTGRLAAMHGVKDEQILLGCGSGEILRAAVLAFASPAKHLVAAAPTFENPVRDVKAYGWPVREIPVLSDLSVDLDRMAESSSAAGLVFLCNPNNPTGTVHGASAVKEFISRVGQASPETIVLVDEAYHEYVEDTSYSTAIPLALKHRQVIVSRTFSKAYGMAGLRVGYVVGQAETLNRLRPYRLPNNVNVLAAAAAIAALGEAGFAERERARNREARNFTRKAFLSAGFETGASHTNFVMVSIGRDVRQFQEACRNRGVLVGRPFPPLNSHVRISVGTLDEMKRAVPVLLELLDRG